MKAARLFVAPILLIGAGVGFAESGAAATTHHKTVHHKATHHKTTKKVTKKAKSHKKVHHQWPHRMKTAVTGEACFRQHPKHAAPYYNCWPLQASAAQLNASKATQSASSTGSSTTSSSQSSAAPSSTSSSQSSTTSSQSTTKPVTTTATSKPTSTTTESPTSTSSTSTSSSSSPSTQSGSPVSVASGPQGDPGSWRLVFDDEFTSDSSLNTSKWSPYWFANGDVSNDTPMDSSNVAISGGHLNLNLTPSGSGGLISTDGHFSFTYGFVEARVFLPAANNGVIANWPAVWADGQSWPADGEMDIMEGLSGQACAHFISSGGSGEANPGICPPKGDLTGWHTFGADWEPGQVTYYYDGTDIGTIKTGTGGVTVTGQPMYLILENSDGSYGGPVVRPTTMEVDYVRVWQH